MNRPDTLGVQDWARLHLLRPGTHSISLSNPLAHAVRYPEIVTIASVLGSPTWQQLAASRHTEQKTFDEIGRRVGLGQSYDWEPRSIRHPLLNWAHDQTRTIGS